MNFFIRPREKQYVNFEYIQEIIGRKKSDKIVLINTMAKDFQKCLIPCTVLAEEEEGLVNDMLDNYEMGKKTIVLYGKNGEDPSVNGKWKQLNGLGFQNVVVYSGGMFEWLLLQDVYGSVEFPTVGKELDILRFR